MLGQLVPRGGGDPIPLLRRKILVGRRSRCDIKLEFPNISSQHCELELVNGYWRIRDLDSTNGIKVNGERCDSHWLMPGDLVQIAKHTFAVEYEPLGTAPPPDTDEVDILAQGLLEKAGLVQDPKDSDSSSETLARRPRLRPTQRPTPPAPRKPPRTKPSVSDSTEEKAFAFLNGDDETPLPGMASRDDSNTDDS